jgi:hypothetical protein
VSLANLNIHRETSVEYSTVLSILTEKGHRRLNFVCKMYVTYIYIPDVL